jgi:hypothetical protein
MSIPAEFDSTCAACGDPIHEGDQIEFSDDWNAWVHDSCHEDA